MVKLSTKIVQMLCDRNIVEPAAEPLHPTRSEIINAIDAVIDLHIYERSELFLDSETDDERSIRITEFLDDADAGLILNEERICKGMPMPKVRYDDGGYELQVLNFDNRWAKMRIIENDEIIFVPPNKLKHYTIIDDE